MRFFANSRKQSILLLIAKKKTARNVSIFIHREKLLRRNGFIADGQKSTLTHIKNVFIACEKCGRSMRLIENNNDVIANWMCRMRTNDDEMKNKNRQ